MKNKKWRLTWFVLWILVAVAIGFFIRGWNDNVLWGGWFAGVSAAVGIFTGGNFADKREYIRAGIDKSETK